jgi:DNA-binding CsgD family transcriptional regulator
MEPRDQVISLMYEAAASPELWPTALAAFADATRSVEASITVLQMHRNPARPFFTADLMLVTGRMWGEEFTDAYVSHYARVDPMGPVVALASPGSLILCHEHLSNAEVAASEFYQDLLIPVGGRYIAGFMEASENLHFTLALHRRDTPFQRDDLASWQAVAKHVRNAVAISSALAPRLAAGESFRSAVDQQRMACVIVDNVGRVLDCSAAALALLDRGTELRLDFESRLRLLSLEKTRQLRNLIASATSGGAGGVVRASEHCLLQVMPSGVSAKSPFDARLANCALIFVLQPGTPSRPDATMIRLYLDCTQAEAEVAVELVAGLAPTAIAAKRGVCVTTIRSQIRILLERTNLRRIAELVGFLSQIS